jgi:hypothetical protein
MQQRFRIPDALPRAMLPFDPAAHDTLGITLTAAGLCSAAMPSGAGPHDRLITLRTAVLRPGVLSEPESWLALLPKEEKLLRGAVLFRADKHLAASQELKAETTPLAMLFRALAEQGLGHHAAARKALEEALTKLQPEKLDVLAVAVHW